MKLAALQTRFLADLISEEEPENKPGAANEGFGIYRNAYRSTLVEVLRDTFARTLEYAGTDGFDRAAAHYLISYPPASWSLDHVGKGFAETLAELFTHDPEVAELAALEWAMHTVFVGADEAIETLESFSSKTQHFEENDWVNLRLEFVSAMTAVPCEFDLIALWKHPDAPPARLDQSSYALVWREDERPVFILVEPLEKHALDMMKAGATFGAICEHAMEFGEKNSVAEVAGGWLQGWLSRGLIAGIAL